MCREVRVLTTYCLNNITRYGTIVPNVWRETKNETDGLIERVKQDKKPREREKEKRQKIEEIKNSTERERERGKERQRVKPEKTEGERNSENVRTYQRPILLSSAVIVWI